MSGNRGGTAREERGPRTARAGLKLLDAIHRAALVVAYRLLRIWWFVRRPEGHGVHVAVWCQGQLLLIRNSYRPGVMLPSGGVDRGEGRREAAQRELFEEVGIEVDPAALASVSETLLDFESRKDHGHFFEVFLDVEPEVRIDRREVVWAEFVDAEELRSLPLGPHLRRYLEQGAPLSSPG